MYTSNHYWQETINGALSYELYIYNLHIFNSNCIVRLNLIRGVVRICCVSERMSSTKMSVNNGNLCILMKALVHDLSVWYV